MSSSQTKETKLSETVSDLIKKNLSGHNSHLVRPVTYLFEQASHHLSQKTLSEAASLLSLFKDEDTVRSIVLQIEYNASYIQGSNETEVISDLGKALSPYPPRVARQILGTWSEVAHHDDYKDPEGALAVSRTMQRKEIVETINGLDNIDTLDKKNIMPYPAGSVHTMASYVAECLANMADYLKDEDCVVSASIAIQKERNEQAAWTLAMHLLETAKELGNRDTMGIGWNTITPQNKVAFVKETALKTELRKAR